MYCPECSHADYNRISLEEYNKKILSIKNSNSQIFSEKDEFRNLGTREKFADQNKQKKARRNKNNRVYKEPVIFCFNCLKTGNEGDFHK